MWNESKFDWNERRRHGRMPIEMSMRCVRFDPDGCDAVDVLETVDISHGGLGAISDGAFYPGQRVVVRLPLSDIGGRRNVYATVTRSDRRKEQYHVGMEFDMVKAGAWCGVSGAAVAAA